MKSRTVLTVAFSAAFSAILFIGCSSGTANDPLKDEELRTKLMTDGQELNAKLNDSMLTWAAKYSVSAEIPGESSSSDSISSSSSSEEAISSEIAASSIVATSSVAASSSSKALSSSVVASSSSSSKASSSSVTPSSSSVAASSSANVPVGPGTPVTLTTPNAAVTFSDTGTYTITVNIAWTYNKTGEVTVQLENQGCPLQNTSVTYNGSTTALASPYSPTFALPASWTVSTGSSATTTGTVTLVLGATGTCTSLGVKAY